jgi:hypothetical protein
LRLSLSQTLNCRNLSDSKWVNDAWRERTRKTLEALDSAIITTIFLRDNPLPGFDAPDCMSGDTSWWARRHANGHNRCLLDRNAALNDGIF